MKYLNIVVFNNLLNDSRLLKHISEFKRHCKVTVICLLHEDSQKKDYFSRFPDVHFIFIPFGGKTYKKSLIDYIHWQFRIRFDCFRILKRQHGLILANDLESLIPAYFARIHNPETIIYDSHEIWTEREGCRKTPLHKIINKIEFHFELRIVKRIKKVITVSKPIANFLKSKWNYDGRIDVIHNIPSEEKTQDIKREQFNIPKANTVFVYIGFISKRRNIDKLLRAFPEQPNLTLLLIGSATNQLYDLIDERKNVVHIDRIPPEKITGYLHLADIGIHPLNTSISLNHKYALPNKVFQYMQAGLALCMFDGISIRDIIDRYNNGIYGNMNTVESIKANIESILSKDIDEMKTNSLKAYQSEYNWENEKKKLQELIEDL